MDMYIEKMKILHITSQMDPEKGGISQGIRTMIEGLNKLGAHSEVVTLDQPGAAFFKDEVIIIHTPGAGKGPWFYNAKLGQWLKANMDRFNAVIIHGLWLYHGYAAWKAVRLLNNHSNRLKNKKKDAPTLFVMPHGMLDPYFQLAEGRKLKAIRNRAYWKLIEGKIINQADGLLFTCEMEKQLARKPFSPYQPKRENVVGLGVAEPPAFISEMHKAFLEKCTELGNNSYFLFLSRIHEKKGVDLLINAYKKIIEQYPGKNIPKLVIAGPGLETLYGDKIQKLILESPELMASVFFPGMLKGNAKWGAFYGCSAFVLPSHQENFGVAVVEAMACSKAVLISNQINICSEIETHNAGIVAEDTPEGTRSLLEKWEQLTSDEKQVMGLQARDCFEKKFAMVPAAKRLLNALNFYN
jgi:glycosyltransferase involved in cell wall biosynthesis